MSDDELNLVVLRHVSAVAKVPVQQIDVRQTLKRVDRSGNDVLTYGFWFTDISRTLGIELSSASPDVAASLKATTVGELYERTPISVLQAVVRGAYANTPNCRGREKS